jgi:predicted PurR-regulated permease PerM
MEERKIVRTRTLDPIWEKRLSTVFVWAVILGVLYLLRSFFLLVFLTFVFAYIQAGGVARLERFIKNRSLRVVIVTVAFLAVIVATSSFIFPHIKREAVQLSERYPLYLHAIDKRVVSLVRDYPLLSDLLPGLEGTMENEEDFDPKNSPTVHLFQYFYGVEDDTSLRENLRSSVEKLRSIGERLLALASAFLLSLLFSFLILLDLPRLTTAVQGLSRTKLRFMYVEVAEGLARFGQTVGRALEAQFFIAIINTALTAIGMQILGMREVAFPSLIVFFCSFVPVVGVFLSSVPICLSALQQSGFGLVFGCIVLITLIHQIEAYVLNPRIYGHHLRMNPVLVLIILTVAGKLFGVWGLVLGVPVARYVFADAIRYPNDSAPTAES